MVYRNLDPTILQSKTCKKMIDVIKSLTSSLSKRKDSLLVSLSIKKSLRFIWKRNKLNVLMIPAFT